jgi:hypothetical protein
MPERLHLLIIKPFQFSSLHTQFSIKLGIHVELFLGVFTHEMDFNQLARKMALGVNNQRDDGNTTSPICTILVIEARFILIATMLPHNLKCMGDIFPLHRQSC